MRLNISERQKRLAGLQETQKIERNVPRKIMLPKMTVQLRGREEFYQKNERLMDSKVDRMLGKMTTYTKQKNIRQTVRDVSLIKKQTGRAITLIL